MGLNPRGMGHSRGGRGNFYIGGCHGNGRTNQGALFTSGPAGMFTPRGPPSAEPQVAGPTKFKSNRWRPGFGKFRQGNSNKNYFGGKSNSQDQEVDMTKPWITAEIKLENQKKEELLETWKETKSKEDWDKYKAQKLNLHTINTKAKAEYSASHPYEVMLPDNSSSVQRHYCETCDKSFRIEDDLLLHEAEHETCYCDGCEFTAHPKIIAKHIKMQHESGLFKRIGNLYTKEDIAKWIEERRKRYPTRKVVEDKKILEEEKLKRGERIKDDDSKFNKSFNNKTRGRRKKNFEKRVLKSKNKKEPRKKKHSVSAVSTHLEEDEADKFRKGVPAFSGIRNTNEPELPEKTKTEISDDEWASECKPANVEEPLLNSSLKLLALFYNSDEENLNQNLENEATECVSGDEDSAPEEVKTLTSNSVNEENSTGKKVSMKRKFSDKQEVHGRKRKNIENQQYAEKRSQTLLEKLLKKEIRRERNIILQCVHYVVNQNFFRV